jgi:hypothetical protein
MGLELMPIIKFSCIPLLFKLFNKGKEERKVNLPYFVWSLRLLLEMYYIMVVRGCEE